MNALDRLTWGLRSFAAGYPDRWRPGEGDNVFALPMHRLVWAFCATIRGEIAQAACQLGAQLRARHGYTTPDHTNEALADTRRGVAYTAAALLHGEVTTDFGGGDRMTADQVAFYIADDWWLGRDDRPELEWADIRRVREQLLLDALDLPADADALAFSAAFLERYPALIEECQWGLGAIGSGEGFEDRVWAATGDNHLWRGVYFLAEGILASLPNGGGRSMH
jgi:hypothetical protein